jgi:adenine-specific DNA methylase
VLASFFPANANLDQFLLDLGIARVQAEVNGQAWPLFEEKLLKRVERAESCRGRLRVDKSVRRWLEEENQEREKLRGDLEQMRVAKPELARDDTFLRWLEDLRPLPGPIPEIGDVLAVRTIPGDPAFAAGRMALEERSGVRIADDPFKYPRAFTNSPPATKVTNLTVLDPTAGGGAIPFESLRLGHRVIANELNPVATVILHATLDYPLRFGPTLTEQIKEWGERLAKKLDADLSAEFGDGQKLSQSQLAELKAHLKDHSTMVEDYDTERIIDYLFVRQVICPHCEGEAPLLNSSWLCKEEGERWGVKIITDGKKTKGKVTFEPFRVSSGKGPNGEDPDFATVVSGVGACIHCRQEIGEDTEGKSEIKLQASGKSKFGRWQDRLFCIVSIRYQPKLDSQGKLQRFKTGDRAGQIKTEKLRYFRAPNATDETALKLADQKLHELRGEWETEGYIPTEEIPIGHRSHERDIIDQYGFAHWTDMFTPRQLLGHGTLTKELRRLTPEILGKLGQDRGRALVTYLQFAMDKAADYNSRFTRWEYTRGVVKGTFGRHDFSLKWTFGETSFVGDNSGYRWALDDVVDAYRGLAELVHPLREAGLTPSVQLINGTAAHIPTIADKSVDLVCMDPPYYNNVQYAELSDFFYVWQKRTLKDFYPDLYTRRLTDKQNEAVANPVRDGGKEEAKRAYERMMGEIFKESARVLKDDGMMTLMFTHKSQDAWETLTRSLIDQGWVITSAFPVESEGENSMHQQEVAAAASTIFLTCRKRLDKADEQATWTGFGGQGIQQRIQTEVRSAMQEFEKLRLNPVDEMVAGYGRALRVLSEHWPVLGEDDQPVSPLRAMTEASRVVAQYQIARLTGGRLKVDDLNPEAAMALTLYGIFGLAEFPYDDARNIANSLNIPLQTRPGGYSLDGERIVGMTSDAGSSRRRSTTSDVAEERGYHAPLVLKGSKLRLARPDERNPKRLERPQTEWDVLHGLLSEYQRGDVPVARAYLIRHAEGRQEVILDLLHVWAEEMPDEKLRKEAQTLLFGLKSVQASG